MVEKTAFRTVRRWGAAMGVAALIGTHAIPVAAAENVVCADEVRTLDWSTADWSDGDLSNVFDVSGSRVQLTISGDTPKFVISEDGRVSPYATRTQVGRNGSTQDVLSVTTGFEDMSEAIKMDLRLGRDGEGVAAAAFSVFGIDAGQNHTDHLRVLAFREGRPVDVKLISNASVTVRGNEAFGTQLSDDERRYGNLIVSITEPVDRVVVSFSNDTSNSVSQSQDLYLHDVSFCPVSVRINAAKRTQSVDGTPAIFLPGREIVSIIGIENTGTGWVDKDTIVLIDAVPQELTFFNGDIDGDGPATGPVEFTDNKSGLRFSAQSDVKFSNASTKPNGMDECDYDAKPGYDAAIRFVCIQPKGALRGDPGGFGFEVAFKVAINSL